MGGTVNVSQFTGDERDSESNLDHTQFRQYSSSLARWMHPDPADFIAANPTNPQSWNRYSYVMNSPTNLIDPFGLYWSKDCTYSDAGTSCTLTWVPDPVPLPQEFLCPPGWHLVTAAFGESVCRAGHQLGDTTGEPRRDRDRDRGGNSSGNNKASKLKGFNACVDQAASVRNRQLIGTTGEIIAGGLVFITVGWLTIESGGILIHEMAAEAASSAPESGFLLFSAATSDLPHVGLMATAATGGTALMAHGSAGELNALNQYDRAVGNCQVKYGFPNVP